MSEPIEWLEDGTPYSPRFSDRYHSEHGGLEQARGTFLAGCGLPQAWQNQPQWRVLETGFGLGLNFLVTWAAWRADPHRPQRLHFVSCEAWPVSAADLLRAAPIDSTLQSLAQQLAAQYWGLLPGVHRLSFDGGQVLLTLYIGDAQALLRQQQPTADSVYLDGFDPQHNPQMWDIHTLKAVARCCRRGTRLATWTVARGVRDGLVQCGFEVQKVPGVRPKRDNLQATYAPRWEPRAGQPVLPDATVAAPARCLVVGAGLAGAAVAASLAHRGWQVQVLDRADHPAAGASGLPAGVFAPNVSQDDNLISRLSRAGVRTTLNTLAQLPAETRGTDWSACGTLEHRVDGTTGLAWSDGPGLDWSRPATPAQLQANGLSADTVACWHEHAGWVRPPQLIAHLLNDPAIRWRGSAAVAELRRTTVDGQPLWQALDAEGRVLAEAELAVVCAGHHTGPLTHAHWPMNPLRGQLAWGLHAQAPAGAPWPPQPLNGNGNLVPRVPLQDGAGWVLGSTFERLKTALPPSPDDQAKGLATNQAKLHALLPPLGAAMDAAFTQAATAPDGPVRTWAAVRCGALDRRPIVGPVDSVRQPGLWLCTALGARGLTLSLLCGELIAARLHSEPLPLDAPLARALSSERWLGYEPQ